jgi:hypothetical protein
MKVSLLTCNIAGQEKKLLPTSLVIILNHPEILADWLAKVD